MRSEEITSDYKKHSSEKRCFHRDKTNCSSQIKKAHSIQKEKILVQLEETINKNRVFYSFDSTKTDENFNTIGFIPIGKKKASIFTGFCGFHDSKLFSPIENFDLKFTQEQKFLISYRSFAHSFHQISEIYNWYLSDAKFIQKLPNDYVEHHKMVTERRICRMSEYKMIIDNLMEKSEYDKPNYHLRIIKPFVPIACSSVLSPMYTYNNRYMRTNWYSSNLILNVIPDNDRTIILLTHFNEDHQGKKLFEELKELNDDDFTNAISSLMIYCTENTFLSPKLWNKFSDEDKLQVFREKDFCIRYGDRLNGFFHSKIDFFKYS